MVAEKRRSRVASPPPVGQSFLVPLAGADAGGRKASWDCSSAVVITQLVRPTETVKADRTNEVAGHQMKKLLTGLLCLSLAFAALAQNPPPAHPAATAATNGSAAYSAGAAASAPQKYHRDPDSLAQEGVPKGKLEGPIIFKSHVFEGTIRKYWIYVPASMTRRNQLVCWCFRTAIAPPTPMVFCDFLS